MSMSGNAVGDGGNAAAKTDAPSNGAKVLSDRLNRSCEACREAKIRCQVKNKTAGAKCQRCQNTNRTCIFVAPSRRKPRKRTDTRIKELEQKLQAMESSLVGPNSRSVSSLSQSQSPNSGEPSRPLASRNLRDDAARTLSATFPTEQERTTYSSESGPTDTAADNHVDNGLALETLPSPSNGEALFSRFLDHYMVEYPLVVFPPGTRAADVRLSKPTLYLAVIAAASGSSEPSLFRALNVKLLEAFAHKVMISSEKNLELVQAMLVMATWCFPPDRFEELKHYQYIHMAATMAMDIGLGEPTESSGGTDFHGSPRCVYDSTMEEIARYRTILSCYLLCAGVALSMDRPTMLNFTPFMQRCLLHLKNSPSAAPTDGKLAAWVELQLISENVGDCFRRSSPCNVSFGDPRVRAHVDGLVRRFEDWRRRGDRTVFDDSLVLAYHYNKARALEVVLYDDHSLEDLRPPFLVRSASVPLPHKAPALSPAYAQTVFSLISEVQECIRTFLEMDIAKVRAAPVMHYIRCFYCLTILLALRTSTQRSGNDLAKILDPGALRIEELLARWRAVCVQAAGKDQCRYPSKFGFILDQVGAWLRNEQTSSGVVTRPRELRLLTLLNAKEPLDFPDVNGGEADNLMSVSASRQDGLPPDQDLPPGVSLGTQPGTGGQYLQHLPPDPQSVTAPRDQLPQQFLDHENFACAGYQWSDAFGYAEFVPMALDDNAMALFEELSNDVAHSFIPHEFEYTDNNFFDGDVSSQQ